MKLLNHRHVHILPSSFPQFLGRRMFLSNVNSYLYRVLNMVQVQVRMPDKLVKDIDRWIAEGRYASRSEAVKTIVAIHREREHTRRFYKMLMERSREAEEKPEKGGCKEKCVYSKDEKTDKTVRKTVDEAKFQIRDKNHSRAIYIRNGVIPHETGGKYIIPIRK